MGSEGLVEEESGGEGCLRWKRRCREPGGGGGGVMEPPDGGRAQNAEGALNGEVGKGGVLLVLVCFVEGWWWGLCCCRFHFGGGGGGGLWVAGFLGWTYRVCEGGWVEGVDAGCVGGS